MPRIHTWQVTGMTCASCERLIGDVLKDVPGVMDVEVSVKLGKAAVRLRDEARDPDLGLLNRQLSAHGYALHPEGCELPRARSPFRQRLVRAVVALLAVGAIAFVASPLRTLVPAAEAGASVGAMIALGLLASVSTCLASTGGFMLAYGSTVRSRSKVLLMHAGRLAAFAVGGAALGAVGGALPQGSTVWYGVLALGLGIGFLGVALNLMELAPSLSSIGIRLPSGLASMADRLRSRPGKIAPFLVGAVTFILPCGFTQTAQTLALTSGSAARGSAMLIAFALGTLPVLLGLTSLGVADLFRRRFVKLAAGATMAIFAFGQIDGGLTVLGSPVTPGTFFNSFAAKTMDVAVPAANAEEQVVRMTIAYGTYQPKNLTVRKGVPVRWEIDGKDISGCANSLVVPSYGISKALVSGLNIVQFTPKDAGTIPFSCAMGMIRGSFTVTE